VIHIRPKKDSRPFFPHNATKEGSEPTDLAFLAMAQHQLGMKDEAKATLGLLREVMKQERWAKDAERQGFLREAEELIEGKPASETTKDSKDAKNRNQP
jgi:hypothetical protein